jgi:hypothetical protein
MKMTKQEKHELFTSLVSLAEKAGMKAAEEAQPETMHLVGRDHEGRMRHYAVTEGVCGFAWVNVTPGTCSFARWARKHDRIDGRPDRWGEKWTKAYRGGVDRWIHEFGQSMTRKEAYARAYAKVLREAGIEASVGSRID